MTRFKRSAPSHAVRLPRGRIPFVRRRSPYLATMGAALAFAFLGLIVIGLVSPH
jgi:hypothetical protein